MNARQAAKAAAKHIEELEDFSKRSSATVRGLYRCIDIIFSGGNICQECDDYEECQLEAKNEGKGCTEWVMRDVTPEEIQEAKDDSERVPITGAEGRA